MNQKTILYCVLNWGIGHATRSTVVIKKLLQSGFDVLIASDGAALKILKSNFPGKTFIELPAYQITYPEQGSMVLTMLKKMPSILFAIKKEKAIVKQVSSKQKIDLIISDHRYGCSHRKIHAVFLAHQLQPLLPASLKYFQNVFNFFHNRKLKCFNEFWIPDIETEQGLSGKLSLSSLLNQRRIGLLSLMPAKVKPVKRFQYIALLSGPEPQRSILEKILSKALQHSGKSSLLIRGVPGEDTEIETNGTYSEVGFLSGKVLAQLLAGAELIFARSGYSSIMDLASLQKKAVFIPTPGQTEQIYLAERLKEKGIAFYMQQHEFDFSIAVESSRNFRGFKDYIADDQLLDKCIQSL